MARPIHRRRLAAWDALAREEGREIHRRRGPGAIAKAVARWKELLADPEYKAAQAEKIRKTRRRRVFLCKECGHGFVRRPDWKGWRVCSKACEKAYKAQRASEVRPSSRPEVRARLMVARRGGALGPGEYEALVRGLSCLDADALVPLSPCA